MKIDIVFKVLNCIFPLTSFVKNGFWRDKTKDHNFLYTLNVGKQNYSVDITELLVEIFWHCKISWKSQKVRVWLPIYLQSNGPSFSRNTALVELFLVPYSSCPLHSLNKTSMAYKYVFFVGFLFESTILLHHQIVKNLPLIIDNY